jgi:hypothetical protein
VQRIDFRLLVRGLAPDADRARKYDFYGIEERGLFHRALH